jgi:methionyl-tRNA synthetase
VRRLNRYVEERAPWTLAKDPAQAAALDQTLASLYAGLRSVSVMLHPYIPGSVEKVLAALQAREPDYAAARLPGEISDQVTVQPITPLFPKRAPS